MSSYDTNQWQKDIAGRLESLPYFSDIPILRDQPGLVDADVEKALTTLNEKSGKTGTCIIVMLPEERVPSRDMVGPEVLAAIVVRTYTDALLNTGANGTGKSNSQIRRRVRKALHHWIPNGSNAMYCGENGSQPLEAAQEGLEIYGTEFFLPMPEEYITPALPMPIIAQVGLGFHISTKLNGAETGAAIWYTTDGSFPAPSQGTSTLFGTVLLTEGGVEMLAENGQPLLSENPIPAAAGTVIRAAAYLDGRDGSPVAMRVIS